MRLSIESLENQFADLHKRSCELVSGLSTELLYAKPLETDSNETCGEQVLRSAAVIEQSFGGLTASLWDDPFEWTLRETLNTPAKVLEYLAEVEETRRRAFAAFKSYEDLLKEIMTPLGNRQLLSFLLDTLERARHHQQRAVELFETLRTENLRTEN